MLLGLFCLLMQRLAIVLSSVLALVVWSLMQDRILNPALAERFGDDTANLSGLFLLIPMACAFTLSPTLRRLFPIRLTWTWVVLIPLSLLSVNLAFLTNPQGISIGYPMASLIIAGFATGFKEELFLRGFAFTGGGESTPRYTVLLTAVCFSLLHLSDLLRGVPMQEIIATVAIAFAFGLSFGVIRIATGSIAWCVLLHGAVDAANSFANNDLPAFAMLAILLTFTALVAGSILMVAHPSMRKDGNLKEGNTNSI